MTAPRWKWRVITLVGRLPGQCWADLVCWAQDTAREQIERADSWRGLIPWSPNRGCGRGTPDFDRNGSCWCGKLMTPELRARVDAWAPPTERVCAGCGCTDGRACPGGCWWATPDLCSTCQRTLADGVTQ